MCFQTSKSTQYNTRATMEARPSQRPPKGPSRPLHPVPFSSRIISDVSKLSASTGSSRRSVATPSSVLVGSITSKSDLSDLTGSYMNGDKHCPIRPGIPSHIYPSDASINSFQRPWHQAYVLSTPSPDESAYQIPDTKSRKQDLIFVEQGGNVEIVRQDEEVSPSITPLLILCMDPLRKLYEIMQISIDAEVDSVRDVLRLVKQKVAEDSRWRQDYDGLLHLKEAKISQLIHCLGVRNYDVQPFEVWIAKPWSLSATVTAHYGVSLVEHLKEIGVVTQAGASYRLSMVAQGRIYGSDTTLDFRHAQQYLAFSPPFESFPFAPSPFSEVGSMDDHSSLHTGGASALDQSRELPETSPTQSKVKDAETHSSSGGSQAARTISSVSQLANYEPYVADGQMKQSEASETGLLQNETTEKWRQYAASTKSRKQLQTSNAEMEEQQLRNIAGCVSKFLCQGRSAMQSTFDGRRHFSGLREEQSFSSGDRSSNGKYSLDFGTLQIDEEVSIMSRDSHRSDTPLLYPNGPGVDRVFPLRKNKVNHTDTAPPKQTVSRAHYRDLF